MVKIFIATFLISFSIFSQADCTTTGCDQVYLELLYVTASGTLYVGTSGDETKTACKPESGTLLTLNLTQPGSNAIYSMLLAAQLANKLVYIRTDEASTGCKIFYATLARQ